MNSKPIQDHRGYICTIESLNYEYGDLGEIQCI